jgi:hypothetical protein
MNSPETTPPVPPLTPAVNASPRRAISIILVIIVVLLALLGGAAFLGWEIFIQRSDAPVIRTIADVVPIPAARLGSRVVLYRDFVRSRDTLRKFLESPAAKQEGLNVPFDETLEQNALEKLLVQQALEELAEQRHVVVTDDELRQYYSEVLASTSSTTQNPSQYLLDNFGWDEEDFRQNVLRPSLLEQKLTTSFAEENPSDTDALNRAIAARMEQKDVIRYVRF